MIPRARREKSCWADRKISTLPSGGLILSNKVHSCLYRGFAVDDVGKGNITMMRAGIVAPAQVHARFLGRNVDQRPVERLDVQCHATPKSRQTDRLTGVDGPMH